MPLLALATESAASTSESMKRVIDRTICSRPETRKRHSIDKRGWLPNTMSCFLRSLARADARAARRRQDLPKVQDRHAQPCAPSIKLQ
jgi:hypothetical protein